MLRNEDAITFLSRVPSQSVDMVLVDPPYFQIAKEDWDHQWSQEDEYISWCNVWTRECFRVLKPGGCF